jgi:uncharacterized protein YkwD
VCALAVAASLPAPAALARRHGAAHHHRASHRGVRQHRARCGAIGGRRHARRSSFRFGSRPHRGGAGRCRGHRGGGRAHLHRLSHTPRGHRAPHLRRTAGRSSGCVDEDLRPNAANLDRIRAATLCLVNRERAAQGQSALVVNPHLASAAQAHTDDMVQGDYFDHVGPRGDTPLSRMRAAGYIYNGRVGYEVGENLGWGTLWLATPRAIVAAWMASAGHRANILNGRYRDTALGVSAHPLASMANGQAGATYTQDFGVIIAG